MEHAEDKYLILSNFMDSLPERRGALIEVLHEALHIFGYLPVEVQKFVAEKLNLPQSKVYGTVTFYNYFTEEPTGEFAVSVCLGTVCFVKGAEEILSEFEKILGIKNEERTPDGMFSLGGLRSVGACSIAPVIMVNNEVYGNFKPEMVRPLIEELKEKSKQKRG